MPVATFTRRLLIKKSQDQIKLQKLFGRSTSDSMARCCSGRVPERPLLLERGEFLFDGADALDARRRLRLELLDEGEGLA